MTAYFEALEHVRKQTGEMLDLVHSRYIQQYKEVIRRNLSKFTWHGVDDQHQVTSDEGIYAQADYILEILHEQMKTIPFQTQFS